MALYTEISNAVEGAIVVQDFPPVNNVIMSPQLLGDLADTLPNLRHLKLEDPPLMQKITAILARTDKYEIFGGLGGMFLLEELKRGAAGTMTGFAFTEILVANPSKPSRQAMSKAQRKFLIAIARSFAMRISRKLT